MDLFPLIFLLLFDIGQLWQDSQFIIKIFVFMAMVNYVMNHLGKGSMGIIVMAGLFVFIFFDLWRIFGTMYVLYIMLAFGFASILIDFFFIGGPNIFMKPQEMPEGMEQQHSPHSAGGKMQHAMMNALKPRPPPPGI